MMYYEYEGDIKLYRIEAFVNFYQLSTKYLLIGNARDQTTLSDFCNSVHLKDVMKEVSNIVMRWKFILNIVTGCTIIFDIL